MALQTLIAVFGATGDLARKKLVPSLYTLFRRGIVTEKTPLLMVGRRPFDTAQYLSFVGSESLDSDLERVGQFSRLITYLSVDLHHPKEGSFAKMVEELHRRHDTGGNLLAYLAIAPALFESALPLLSAVKGAGHTRVVFEKPFGHDLPSAQRLNQEIARYFSEDQIYRIDHYLGKSLVQTLLGIRFANPIFELLWSREHLDQVQLTVSETVGVGSRAGYYDNSGALLDMVQNHLLQVLSLVAMEPPESMDPDEIRSRKTKLLHDLAPFSCDDLVVGQYTDGVDGDTGEKVPAYVKEPGIQATSKTETFAALRLFVENDRWQGVPFYIRTGKRMSKRAAYIHLVLKPPKSKLMSRWFKLYGSNVITIRVQPDEGMGIQFLVKVPGVEMELTPAELDFCYPCRFAMNTPEAYEILLEEALRGDQTLFTRWDFLEKSWHLIDKIKAHVAKCKVAPDLYPAGSEGPTSAERLLAARDHKWIPMPDHDY